MPDAFDSRDGRRVFREWLEHALGAGAAANLSPEDADALRDMPVVSWLTIAVIALPDGRAFTMLTGSADDQELMPWDIKGLLSEALSTAEHQHPTRGRR